MMQVTLQTMAQCPSCGFSFCALCQRAFHGIAPCSFSQRDANRLLSQYEAADAKTRAAMEQRYGRRTLAKLVEEADSLRAKIDEEASSEQLIKEVAKPCPNCRASIEKNEGCNKMACTKCGKFFCWLCLHIVPASNPYSHFNNPKSPCFNQLFEGVITEPDWEDQEDDGVWFMRN